MKLTLTIIEWALAFLAMGAAVLSVLIVMFIDRPDAYAKLATTQRALINYQGYAVLLVLGSLLGAFALQFVAKQGPWAHIAGAISISAFVYFYFLYIAITTMMRG